LALLCILSLGACAAESEGEGQNNIGMGAQGGVGAGAGGIGGGVSGIAGMGGAAGMMNVGGVGGMVAAGGVGGMGTAGVGGVGGMVAGGAGGEGGTMTTGGVGGMGEGGSVAMEWEDKGLGDGSDVITIGDSYMNYGSNGVEISLERISGRDYRNYAVAGTMVLDGVIPRQFTSAVAENANIKTVVMTGGGNDILLGNIFCTVSWAESCNQTVRDVADALAEMRADMAEAGVEDVVLVSYGYPTNTVVRPGLELARELAMTMCVPGAMPRCHWIDPVVELEGKLGGDGIHPTPEGYDILGQMVWDLMEERGLRR
jgi:lysophospholipase L1-like esterase